MQCLNKTIAVTFKKQMMNSKQTMASKEERQDPRLNTMNIPREDTGYTQQGNKVLKTRYGRAIRKPDRLKYE